MRIPLKKISDERGSFHKILSNSENLPPLHFVEIFYSKSLSNCVRGFHLQTHSHSNHRLITVTEGEVIDYLIDLRPESETFCNVIQNRLDLNSDSILIPPGVAHAFYTLKEATMLYATTSYYNPDYDTGVRFNSVVDTSDLRIDFISSRDLELPTLDDFLKNYHE